MSTLYVNNIEPVSGSSLTLISASLVAVDNLTVTSLTSSFQGDLQGTSSYSTQALSSSYSTTSSFSTTALVKYDGPTYDINAVACLTQAQYEALTPDNTTLYFIV